MDGVPNAGPHVRVARILDEQINRAQQLEKLHAGLPGRGADAAEDRAVAELLTGLLAHHTADHAITAGGTTS